MTGPTFLLGLGAQKAGTTWLGAELQRLPYANFGFLKEYHVFDTLHAPGGGRTRAKLEAQAKALLREGTGIAGGEKRLWRRLAFLAEPSSYFDYFEGLTGRAHPGITLTGDITPSYCRVPAAALQQIRDALRARGFRVRVVFVMRDPVDRCWSSVRMERRNALKQHRTRKAGDETEEQELLRRVGTAYMAERTAYDRIVARIERTFAPEEIVLALYETMMRPEGIAHLAAGIGLDGFAPNVERRPNATERTEEIPDDSRATIAAGFRPAYQAAADRFGRETILGAWPNARFVL